MRCGEMHWDAHVLRVGGIDDGVHGVAENGYAGLPHVEP